MDEEYAHLFPIRVEVEQGKTYYWCGCARTKTPPFCDQNMDCEQKAQTFVATLNEEVNLCNCKQTKNPPFCDGSHGKLLIELIKQKQRR